MAIPIECKACGTKAKAPNVAAGKTVACPQCRARLRIPAIDDYLPEITQAVEDEPPARAAGWFRWFQLATSVINAAVWIAAIALGGFAFVVMYKMLADKNNTAINEAAICAMGAANLIAVYAGARGVTFVVRHVQEFFAALAAR